jgi:spore coat protein U-like protein
MKKRLLLTLLLALTLIGKAQAQLATCTPTVSPPSIPALDPLANPTYDTTANLSVTCKGVDLTVSFCFTIGNGSGGVNSNGQRLLTGPSGNTVPFQFFTNSSRTQVWNTSSVFQLPLTLLGSATVNVPIYLRFYLNQTTPGTYSSTFSGNDALLQYGIGSILSCNLLTTKATTSFTVQLTLGKSCVLSAISPVAFGNVTVTSLMGNVTAIGGLSVQCTNTTPYTVGLDNGQGIGVTNPAARKMTGPGGATLTYGLYQDSAHSLVWGNTTGTGGNTQGGTGSGNVTAYTVYGLMPPQTTPTAGSYSDTVGITVTY